MSTCTMELRSRSSAQTNSGIGENVPNQPRSTVKKAKADAKGKRKVNRINVRVALREEDVVEIPNGDLEPVPVVPLPGPSTGLANSNPATATVTGFAIGLDADEEMFDALEHNDGNEANFLIPPPPNPNNGFHCPGTPITALICPPKKDKCIICDGTPEDRPPPPPPRRGLWWLLFLLFTYLFLTLPLILYFWPRVVGPGGPGQWAPCPPGGGDPGLPIHDVPGLKTFLANYNADGTGLPDLALESIGGSIVSVRHTKVLDGGNFVAHAQNMDLMHVPNKPSSVIQVGNTPGICWAYVGGNGSLVIRLARSAVISSFHLEHVSKKLAVSGNINSAPRKFQVYGLEDWTCTKYDGWFRGPETDDDYDCPSSQVLLGDYEFLDNGVTNQKFEVQNPTTKPFPIVELRILSNHGQEFTCVYRFRVHGNITHNQTSAKAEPCPPSAEQEDEEEATVEIEAEPGETDVNVEDRARLEGKMKLEQGVSIKVEAGGGAS